MVAAKAGAAAGEPQRKAQGARVQTQRQRQRIAVEESQRLHQVLQHPLYLKDPIAAITNHLNNTLPPAPAAKPAKGAKPGGGPRKSGKPAQKA
jgi:hypothetical protein